jgi:hypothetical protein
MDSEKTSVSIYDTTFAYCATNWSAQEIGQYGYGGACWLQCQSLILARSCGYYCTAYYWGQFMGLFGSGPVCSLAMSTFLLCGVLHTDHTRFGDYGGIEIGPDFSPILEDLNFTACKVHFEGSAILCREGSKPVNCLRMTVYGCCHSSTIEIDRSPLPAISLCNFYNCSVGSRFVLTGSRYGMVISECIFNGNGNLKDIGLQNTAASKFEVGNCVFSDSLPSDSYAIFVLSNPSSSTTVSYPLFAMMTQYCPAIPLQTVPRSVFQDDSSRSLPTATVSLASSSFTSHRAIYGFHCLFVHFGVDLFTFMLFCE